MIRVDPSHPANRLALSELRSRAPRAQPVVPAAEANDPYYRCGCHPDTVERIWDDIGKHLPSDGRCVVYGTPALVQPESGVILALCMGTRYCLRVPEDVLPAALAAGCTQSQEWGEKGSGQTTNLIDKYGPDWVFSSWSKDELAWCVAAYERFGVAMGTDAGMLTTATPAAEA